MSRPMLILRFAHWSLLQTPNLKFWALLETQKKKKCSPTDKKKRKKKKEESAVLSSHASDILTAILQLVSLLRLDIWLPFWRVTQAAAAIVWDVIDLNRTARWPVWFPHNAVVVHTDTASADSHVSPEKWQLWLEYSIMCLVGWTHGSSTSQSTCQSRSVLPLSAATGLLLHCHICAGPTGSIKSCPTVVLPL